MSRQLIAGQTKKSQAPFTPAPRGLLQRKCACGESAGISGQCDECGKKELSVQRRATTQNNASAVPPVVHEVLRSSGQALDSETRTFMEPRFGHDFSRVRVHAGGRAAESARAVSALAYTVGNNIVFGEGKYQPKTIAGRQLLAHELTHVIQQGLTLPSAELRLSHPHDVAEREADAIARDFQHGSASSVKRQEKDAGLQRAEDTSSIEETEKDNAGPDDARQALVDILGEERLRRLEEGGEGDLEREAWNVGNTVGKGGNAPTISRMVNTPSLMAAAPVVTVIAGIAAASLICASGWFFYTEANYMHKSDKWRHCFASCKISTYCGGPILSAIIGGGKEVADWIGEQFGIPMQAEWDDFVADIEGNICSVVGVFSTCYDCCQTKRP